MIGRKKGEPRRLKGQPWDNTRIERRLLWYSSQSTEDAFNKLYTTLGVCSIELLYVNETKENKRTACEIMSLPMSSLFGLDRTKLEDKRPKRLGRW